MTRSSLSPMHAAVMVTTLVCLTVLGATHVLSGEALSPILAGIAGVVFGAAASQSAANGSAHTVTMAALDHAEAVEERVRSRTRDSRRG